MDGQTMTKSHSLSRDWDRRERRLDWLAEAPDRWHKRELSDKLPERTNLPLVHLMPGLNFKDRRLIVTDFLYSWAIGAVEVQFANGEIEKEFREHAQFLSDNPSAPEAQVKETVHWILGFLIDGRINGTIQGVTKKIPTTP
jgi:hypothetical protein